MKLKDNKVTVETHKTQQANENQFVDTRFLTKKTIFFLILKNVLYLFNKLYRPIKSVLIKKTAPKYYRVNFF